MADNIKGGFRPPSPTHAGIAPSLQPRKQAPASPEWGERPAAEESAEGTVLRQRQAQIPTEPERDAKGAPAAHRGPSPLHEGPGPASDPRAAGSHAAAGPARFDTQKCVDRHAAFMRLPRYAECAQRLETASALSGAEKAAAAESLARGFGGPKMAVDDGLALAQAIVRRVGDGPGAIREGAHFTAGFLRALGDETHIARVVQWVFEIAVSAHVLDQAVAGESGHDGLAGPERLLQRIEALTLGVGGRQMAAGRMQQLVDLLVGLEPLTGDGYEPLRPEDLAIGLASICVMAGERQLPLPLLRIVLGVVLSPELALDENQRGCMVYRLAEALQVWRSPASHAPGLLAAVARSGLPPDHIGAMAWGLGLHLCGVDPEGEEGWHDEHTDIVSESATPPARVVGAVVAMARSLPPASLAPLTRGLSAAMDTLEEGQDPALPAVGARSALRDAIEQAKAHCSAEQVKAMREGCEADANGAEKPHQQPGAPAKDTKSKSKSKDSEHR